jgi:hypothetical protein
MSLAAHKRAMEASPDFCPDAAAAATAAAARWTMYLNQEQLPWKPSIVLSGKTFYTIDLKKKQVLRHVDEWDVASHNKFFSVGDTLAPVTAAVSGALTFTARRARDITLTMGEPDRLLRWRQSAHHLSICNPWAPFF